VSFLQDTVNQWTVDKDCCWYLDIIVRHEKCIVKLQLCYILLSLPKFTQGYVFLCNFVFKFF